MTWWIWVATGIVLCLAELAVPAFFILWFGVAAIATGLLLLVLPDLPLAFQLAFFGLVSIGCVVGWFRLFRSRFGSKTAITGEAEAVGERGTVIVGTSHPHDLGRARFATSVLSEEVWDVVADDPLKVGNSVRVVAVLGGGENDAEGRPQRILKVKKVS